MPGEEKVLVADIVRTYHRRAPSRSRPTAMKPYETTISGVGHQLRDGARFPGGKFKMGSPESENGRKPDEGPVHEVEIAPFWMGKMEVTWNEFELFMYPAEEKT